MPWYDIAMEPADGPSSIARGAQAGGIIGELNQRAAQINLDSVHKSQAAQNDSDRIALGYYQTDTEAKLTRERLKIQLQTSVMDNNARLAAARMQRDMEMERLNRLHPAAPATSGVGVSDYDRILAGNQANIDAATAVGTSGRSLSPIEQFQSQVNETQMRSKAADLSSGWAGKSLETNVKVGQSALTELLSAGIEKNFMGTEAFESSLLELGKQYPYLFSTEIGKTALNNHLSAAKLRGFTSSFGSDGSYTPNRKEAVPFNILEGRLKIMEAEEKGYDDAISAASKIVSDDKILTEDPLKARAVSDLETATLKRNELRQKRMELANGLQKQREDQSDYEFTETGWAKKAMSSGRSGRPHGVIQMTDANGDTSSTFTRGDSPMRLPKNWVNQHPELSSSQADEVQRSINRTIPHSKPFAPAGGKPMPSPEEEAVLDVLAPQAVLTHLTNKYGWTNADVTEYLRRRNIGSSASMRQTGGNGM